MSKKPIPKRRYRKYGEDGLTPAKKKFAQVYAMTDNASEAVRQAFPEYAKNTSQSAIGFKGHDLLKNPNIINHIEYQRDKLEKLATDAVNRVGELIQSDNEQVATANAWKTIEQVQGKAVQRLETKSQHVTLQIDLSAPAEEAETVE